MSWVRGGYREKDWPPQTDDECECEDEEHHVEQVEDEVVEVSVNPAYA